jgi:hypothetical protein
MKVHESTWEYMPAHVGGGSAGLDDVSRVFYRVHYVPVLAHPSIYVRFCSLYKFIMDKWRKVMNRENISLRNVAIFLRK